MKKIYIFLFLFIAFRQDIVAQDIHFSQFFNIPGLLNPAQSGQYRLTYRAIVNYRNQWSTIPAPYVTPMLYGDLALMSCKLKGDHMGLSLTILNDRAGNGDLNTFQTKIAYAYHKALDLELHHQISAGFQVDFTRKAINFSKLLFQSQYIGNDFDGNIASNEPIRNDNFSYIDLNAGLLWTSIISKRTSFNIGASIHHLTQPRETFLREGKKLGMKIIGHGSAQIQLGPNFTTSPAIMYAQQTGAQEIVLGNAFGYNINMNTGRENLASFYIGLWYRLQDAYILFTGVDYRNVRFSFSYDINNSGLKPASLRQGGAELSLAYVGFMKDCRKKYGTLFCPRF